MQVSAAGQRVTSNVYEIDGVSVNSLEWGGAAVITPNSVSVAEINVVSTAYDASLGRNSGAHTQITINGSNFGGTNPTSNIVERTISTSAGPGRRKSGVTRSAALVTSASMPALRSDLRCRSTTGRRSRFAPTPITCSTTSLTPFTFGEDDTHVENANFGRADGTFAGRVIELQARFSF